MEIIIHSKNDVPIRLTNERWEHIESRHPEVVGQRNLVLAAVSDPDMIQKGDAGELLGIKNCESPPMPGPYLVVAYREITEEDGFILTSYFTRRPSTKREILWKR